MKRTALVKHLESHSCRLLREGRRHTIYYNPVTRRTSSIPRHTEIADKLALKICRDLAIPQP